MDASLSVAKGYAELARWWVDAWGAQMRRVATAAASDSYTADKLTADIVASGFLVAETMFRVVNEGMEAVGTMAAGDNPRRLSLPKSFTTDGVKGSSLPRDLVLEGPLKNGSKERPDELSILAVNIRPRHLEPGQTSFDLSADVTDRQRGAYTGAVAVKHGATVLGRVEVVIPV